MIKSVNEIILAGMAILIIMGVLMAVLSHVHLDHIDVNVMMAPASVMIGVTAYSFLSLSRRSSYVWNHIGTHWNSTSNTMGQSLLKNTGRAG